MWQNLTELSAITWLSPSLLEDRNTDPWPPHSQLCFLTWGFPVKMPIPGIPGWLSQLSTQLQLRSWSHCWWARAPCWAWHWPCKACLKFFLSLSLLSALPPLVLSLSQINKLLKNYLKIKINKIPALALLSSSLPSSRPPLLSPL